MWQKTIVLTLALLTTFLSGCAAQQTKIPDAFLEPTPVPELQGETWRDVALWCVELEAALQSCNIDKTAAKKLNK